MRPVKKCSAFASEDGASPEALSKLKVSGGSGRSLGKRTSGRENYYTK